MLQKTICSFFLIMIPNNINFNKCFIKMFHDHKKGVFHMITCLIFHNLENQTEDMLEQ